MTKQHVSAGRQTSARWAAAAIGALGFVTFADGVHAQEKVSVTVNYALTLKLDGDSADAVIKTQSDGRRSMYAMISGECTTLEQTIARSCRLMNVNVRSSNRPARRGNQQDTVTIRGTGTYSVEMK
ncbi:MAG: hypothetical protein AAFQ42_11780 [Pseudomonadota bacterium]